MRVHALSALLLSFTLAGCAGSIPPSVSGAAAPSPKNEIQEEALQPLDHASLVRGGAAASWLSSGDLVLGVEIGGDARAYPLRIVEWHGVINDTIDGKPAALAYCRPCGSAALYRTDTPKGTLTLASSGRFREGDQLLVDRQTGTVWAQLTGAPVEGSLAGSGTTLQPLPVVLTTWTSWFQIHPQTRVLSLETGSGKKYEAGGRPGTDPALPVSRRSPAVPEASTVYGLALNGAAKAYPVDRAAKAGTVNDELGGQAVVIVAVPGDPKNRTVRAYERGDRAFAPGRTLMGLSFVTDQDGRAWKVGEDALASPDGRKLRRIPGSLTLWPGWFAAYPQTGIHGE
jgi:hypothetical protein